MKRNLITIAFCLIGAMTFSQTEVDYSKLGDELFNSKKYKEANEAYSKAIKKDSTKSETYFKRGKSYFMLENDKDAIKDYDKALKLDNKNADIYFYRGQSFGYLGAKQKAISDYDNAIKYAPNYVYSYINKAYILMGLENYKDAKNTFSIAIKISPKEEANLYEARGYCLQMMDSNNQALVDYKKSIELDPNNATEYLNIGNVYFALSQFDNAITSFDKGIKIDPQDAQLYYVRGKVFYKKKELDNACIDWKKAKELGKKEAQTYIDQYCNSTPSSFDSTNYYVQKSNSLPQDKHKERIALLDKAIEISKKENNGTLFFIVQNRINEYIALKDYKKAETDYLYLLKENEKTPFYGIGDIYCGLANLYRDTKKYSQAVEYYKKAINSNSTVGLHFVFLDFAKCQVEMGKYDDAIANINNGLKALANDDPNVIKIDYYKSKDNIPAEYFILMFQRASIYLKQGKKNECCQDLKTILSLDSNADIFKIQAKAKELQKKECK